MGAGFRLVCLAVLITAAGRPPTPTLAPARPPPTLRTGDLVFQASTSSRSALIRKASGSPYSHVGIVEVAGDGVFVIEAIEPVSRTPWARWRARGVGAKVLVLRDRGATPAALADVVREARKAVGTPYDARYRWDDERLYCSELVVKAWARGLGVSPGVQQPVRDLALTPAELALARAKGINPDQHLVTPGSLATDPRFEVVHSDF
ncbi:MAG: peptidase [Myxococcaceae bacterium]|nr:peptidase [Myxococcaceae bacterium]MCA3015939.1 peptidase [Myxococcaceae bacterium]